MLPLSAIALNALAPSNTPVRDEERGYKRLSEWGEVEVYGLTDGEAASDLSAGEESH